MSEKETGNLLINTAVALFAGALGSVLTLAATNRLSVVEFTAPPPAQVSGATVQPITNEPATPDVSANAMLALRESLQQASAERSQLSETLILLDRKLDALEGDILALTALDALPTAIPATGSEALADQSGFVNGGGAFQGSEDNAQQRVQNLIAAGVDEQTARNLQSRRDQYQLARLELFDQASREGWSDSDQLNERLEALDEDRVDLRQELGDEAYDRYLYESGTANRVSISSIITGSAADTAGLQIGDLIVSYADERVFQVRELQSATRAGTRDEYVQVVFDRGGQPLSTDVPRGPLGVTLSTSRVAP